MRALVKVAKGPGLVEIREVPEPRPERGEVLIKVRAGGICGTDIHILSDQFPYWPPVILGHEFAGEIAELGDGVHGWAVGDRVVTELHTRACGQCRYCRTGNLQICPSKRAPGWGIDGCFAEFIAMPAALLHRIPDNVSFEQAAVVEPTAIAAQAMLDRGRVMPADLVVVLGPGPVGLLCAQIAKSCGAKVVITGAPTDADLRLPVARNLGIDHVINIAEEDPLELVKNLTGGVGADVVVECAGVSATINQAIDMVRPHGRIIALGIPEYGKLGILWSPAVFKAIDIAFSFSSKYLDWERALAMISTGQVRVDPLVTHKFPLAEWELAFKTIEGGKGIKGLLIP
ncbi:MAG: zinc-dependent alcohol dehydrogenase [Bacillota bacterium]